MQLTQARSGLSRLLKRTGHHFFTGFIDIFPRLIFIAILIVILILIGRNYGNKPARGPEDKPEDKQAVPTIKGKARGSRQRSLSNRDR
jgi:hypothetical protein